MLNIPIHIILSAFQSSYLQIKHVQKGQCRVTQHHNSVQSRGSLQLTDWFSLKRKQNNSQTYYYQVVFFHFHSGSIFPSVQFSHYYFTLMPRPQTLYSQ